MRTEVISASAGTGKTYRLAEELKRELLREQDPIAPERVIAVTFTRAAAAELAARVRRALLDAGEVLLAHRLAAARIGTIHSVCAHIVREHAFELGLSPELMTLDERLAEQSLKNALEQQVTEDERAVLEELDRRFGGLNWHITAKVIIDRARENGAAVDLDECARRSLDELLATLPAPGDGAALETELLAVIEQVLAGEEPKLDSARQERQELREVQRAFKRGERIPWPRWRAFGDSHMTVLRRFGEMHVDHPQLRADLELAVRTVFAIAARARDGYEAEKRSWGVFDFVDQEAFALSLLQNPSVRPQLKEQIGLVLVDEFQDTSPLQLAILTELSALAEKTVFVGDQKQAIFGFRGADPRLMEAVIDAIATSSEPLSVSYRSRPALVSLTSSLFAPAFAAQGVPADRVHITAKLEVEPPGLGAFLERWRLSDHKLVAREIAAGVAELIEDDEVTVRERSGAVVSAAARHIAVLARTNRQARDIATALQDAGIHAVLRRRGLAASVEARALAAGLALFHDGHDALAAAELARLTRGAGDPDAWLAALVAPRPDGAAAFVVDPYVAAVAEVAKENRQAGVVLAVDLVIEALRLRDVCASWGEAEQRLANLGALRALAVRFVEERVATGAGATVVGFLARLEELADDASREESPDDEQGDVSGQDAVEVSTWHKAKGREWPVVVLAQLVHHWPPSVCGVHVESDGLGLDVNDPLRGRWVRYWPHPYGDRQDRPTERGKGGVVDVLARHPWQAAMDVAQKREELRLLYVGWTRARDRLVLPSVVSDNGPGGRTDLWTGQSSVLRHLAVDGSQPLGEPDGEGRARWAGHDVVMRVREPRARPPRPPPPGTRAVYAPLPPAEHAPAFVAPSAVAEEGEAGEPVVLGAPLMIADFADEDTMARLGTAVHAFFAVDPRVPPAGAPPLAPAESVDDNDRFRLAERLLNSHDVAALLQPGDVVTIADRLWAALLARWPGARVRRESHVTQRLPAGTVVRGQMDLVLETDEGFVIVDHKTYITEDAVTLSRSFAGQLRTYARALSAATNKPVLSTWAHLPLSAMLIEVR